MKSGQNKRIDFLQMATRIFHIAIFLFLGIMLNAQEAMDSTATVTEKKPVKKTFESSLLMNANTIMVPYKNSFQMDFSHRFGTWEDGYEHFYGIFNPSNIRIGFDFVPVNKLMVGFGFSNQNNLWDGYAKYALLQQKTNGGTAISLTYYVNAAVDTREKENTNFLESSDRWSFFNQIMIARKFSDAFSLQLSGNLSWFNYSPVYDAEGVYLGRNNNATFSAGALARYKISKVFSLTAEYDLPITDQVFFDPEPNLSFGFEVTTSAHSFQVFVGNYQSLIPQYNHALNTNSFGDNQILIGFNLTRLWSF
jgi:hypothetical protein